MELDIEQERAARNPCDRDGSIGKDLDGDPSLATAFGWTFGEISAEFDIPPVNPIFTKKYYSKSLVLAHGDLFSKFLERELSDAIPIQTYIQESKLSDELRKIRNANSEIDFRLGLFDKKNACLETTR